MKTVCTEHMAEQIIAAICRVRARAWRTQPQRPWLEVSQPEDVFCAYSHAEYMQVAIRCACVIAAMTVMKMHQYGL